MSDFSVLTARGLSVPTVAGFGTSGLRTPPIYGLELLRHALTFGTVILGPGRIALTPIGRANIAYMSEANDPQARFVLRTVFGQPRTYGTPSITFGRNDSPSSGFTLANTVRDEWGQVSEWLRQRGYRRSDWGEMFRSPLQRRRDVVNGLHELKKLDVNAPMSAEWRTHLFTWAWYVHHRNSKAIEAWHQPLTNESGWWDGPSESRLQDLQQLIRMIDRAYPRPVQPNYGSTGISGAMGGC